MSNSLATREDAPLAATPANLFGTDDPGAVVARATKTANALADVIKKRQLYKTISGKNHVTVGGWTLLGSMLGVFPVLESCEEVEVDGARGWSATVTAQTRSGEVVGRATALCLRSEQLWKSRDEYALCSMAQTRATSKALRGPLGFVIKLAGYQGTPAEEMPAEPMTEAERVDEATTLPTVEVAPAIVVEGEVVDEDGQLFKAPALKPDSAP